MKTYVNYFRTLIKSNNVNVLNGLYYEVFPHEWGLFDSSAKYFKAFVLTLKYLVHIRAYSLWICLPMCSPTCRRFAGIECVVFWLVAKSAGFGVLLLVPPGFS